MTALFDTIVNRMSGYIHTLAVNFEHNSHPYDRNDFMQEASLGIWEAMEKMPEKPETMRDYFWKKVIRNRMLNFHKMSIKKVNRAQQVYREQADAHAVEDDFSDSVILKVAMEEYNENS